MLITEQQLKEWEEIEKSATPGPWEIINAYDYEKIIIWQYISKKEFVATENDIEFMQMARTAVPLLIQTVRELQEENRALHGISRKVVLNLPEALAQERNEIADFIRGGIRSDMSDVIKFVLSNLEDLIRKRE